MAPESALSVTDSGPSTQFSVALLGCASLLLCVLTRVAGR
jgi:hypothetical protein